MFLADGTVYRAKEVILATWAFYLDENLQGILMPFISYLVSVPINGDGLDMENREELKRILGKDSPNYINLDNVYDWSINNNQIRISGEDSPNFHSPISPLEKISSLCNYVYEMHPFLKQNQIKSLSGIYSVTADLLPIVGKINEKSRVTYMVGCNADG